LIYPVITFQLIEQYRDIFKGTKSYRFSPRQLLDQAHNPPGLLPEAAPGSTPVRVGISGTGSVSESAAPFLSKTAMRRPYHSDKGAAVNPWAKTLRNTVVITTA
jgi:hypothetical protein